MGTNKSKAYYKATTTDASQIAYEMEGTTSMGWKAKKKCRGSSPPPFLRVQTTYASGGPKTEVSMKES